MNEMSIINKTSTKFGDAAAAIIYMRSVRDFIEAIAEISPSTVISVRKLTGVVNTLSEDELESISTYLKIPGTVLDVLNCPVDDAAGMADVSGLYSALKSKYNFAVAIYTEIGNECIDASNSGYPSSSGAIYTLLQTMRKNEILYKRASNAMNMLNSL